MVSTKDELINNVDGVYRSALYLVKNQEDAEDLVQETFFKAFRFLDNNRNIEYEKAWLFKILMNTFINKYRKSQSNPTLVAFDSVESYHASIEEEALNFPVMGNEERFADLLDSEVKNALEALPDDFRIAILLSIVEGFTYNEISEILGIPIGTVMSRIYRGKKILKEELRSYAKRLGYERRQE